MNGFSADLLLAIGSAAAVLVLGLVFYGATLLVLRGVIWVGGFLTSQPGQRAGLPHEQRQTAAGGGEIGRS
jgi:hypothetical protein